MPFKSQAQRVKFLELVKSGKMSQSTYNEWDQATAGKKLPERIGDLKIKKIKTTKVLK